MIDRKPRHIPEYLKVMFKDRNYKMIKKLFSACLILMISTSFTLAQDYRTAVGLRAGYSSGFNGKHFLQKNTAVEAILTGYAGGFELTGLYQLHLNAFDTPFLKWYFGPGVHVNFFSENNIRPGFFDRDRATGFSFGPEVVLGMEYTLTDIPFVIGADIKPALDFLPESYFYITYGLSLRFYFRY